jgi:hypothetical protein
MDPFKVREIVNVSLAACHDEARRYEGLVVLVALVTGETGEEAVGGQYFASRTAEHVRKSNHGNVGTVLGRRGYDKPLNAQLPLESWLMHVWFVNRPSVNAGDHEGLVLDGNN